VQKTEPDDGTQTHVKLFTAEIATLQLPADEMLSRSTVYAKKYRDATNNSSDGGDSSTSTLADSDRLGFAGRPLAPATVDDASLVTCVYVCAYVCARARSFVANS